MRDYSKLYAAGGSLSYNELLKEANINSPFDKSTIINNRRYLEENMAKYIKKF